MTPARRRLFKPFVWPAVLLIIGAGLELWAGALAAQGGAAFRLFGLVQGVADLTVLIGGVWLVVAIVRCGLTLARMRRGGRA